MKDNQMDLFPDDRTGYRLIFRPWIKHPRTGKIIYPKHGRVFPIWVRE